jgi:hypothetical protein
VSHARTNLPSGERPVQILYRGKCPWKSIFRFLALSLLFGAVAVAFAASEDFRTKLRVERSTAPWAAALAGGGATILFVCAAWMWHVRLRWVVVTPDGIEWQSGRPIWYRKWEEYDRIERGSIEISVWGEELKAGRYADVHFKTGRRLRISTHNIEGYEDLLSRIQTSARSGVRVFVPGASGGGHGQHTAIYGPLQFDDSGVGWGGHHYRWEEIECYEVASGMLRIQPSNGPEFLRRLCDLGEWTPAVAWLDSNIGSRRVERGRGVPQAQVVQHFRAAPSATLGYGQ